MIKTIIDEKYEFDIQRSKGQIIVNGEPIECDIKQISEHSFHIIYKNKSFKATVTNSKDKSLIVKINGQPHNVIQLDELDMIVENAGLPMAKVKMADALFSPMPGLIQEIMVSEGQQVTRDEPIVILKAMKMENILKSPQDATVKKIMVAVNQKIEKGCILIQF